MEAGVPPMAREAVFDFGITAGAGKAIQLWKQSGGDMVSSISFLGPLRTPCSRKSGNMANT